MSLQLSSTVTTQICLAAKALHINEDSLLDRAVRYYLDAIRGEVSLQQEFGAWDLLSDEALTHFEQN